MLNYHQALTKARSLNCPSQIVAYIEYIDGSIDDEFIVADSAMDFVKYKDKWDDESFEEYYYSGTKFDAPWLDLFAANKTIIKAAFLEWMKDKGAKVVKVIVIS